MTKLKEEWLKEKQNDGKNAGKMEVNDSENDDKMDVE